jgi:hypothetical protein
VWRVNCAMRPEDVFAQYLSEDPAIIERIVIERNFQCLKVSQLKEILRYYKEHGHSSISTTQNKFGLIQTLIHVLNVEMGGKEFKSSESSSPQGGKPNGENQIKKSSSTPLQISSVPHPPCPPLYPMMKISHSTGSTLLPFSSPFPHGFPPTDDDGEEEDDHEHMPPPQQQPSPQCNTAVPMTIHDQILLNPLNRRVFAELQMSSFTPNQIHEAIKENYTTADSILDFDLLMIAILNHVEVTHNLLCPSL